MKPILKRALTAVTVVRALGPSWALERARYEFRLRSGMLRKQLPSLAWNDVPLESYLDDAGSAVVDDYLEYRKTHAPAFFFDPGDRDQYADLLQGWDTIPNEQVHQADQIVDGVFTYFSHLKVDLGLYPDWHRNALTGEEAPRDRHWSEIGDFGYGDIKVIWEPSRFCWAYDLVRAYWRTGDDRYPERFWQLLEHWADENQPNRGPNWKCGQETSIRVMAWCFALYGFLNAPATTPDRVHRLAQLIAFSGQRVHATLDYALSQKNNHGVSEGMGLWTIGVLFPEFRNANQWKDQGRAILDRLALELVYEDGAFSQHSTNYHRVMLDAYVWALVLGEKNQELFSGELMSRIVQAANLLYQMQDDFTGHLPCYGANDGALILPLSNASYGDYRPVVQAARYLEAATRTYASGPWDESLLWLFGPKALGSSEYSPLRSSSVSSSGYATLRSSEGLLFSRCPTSFNHRPGNADILAVDLWWKGINIAKDPGTYSYNAPHPWNNVLRSSRYHNVVTVDGMDQMEPVSRFLWAPWLNGKWYKPTTTLPDIDAIEGEHDGYLRLKNPVNYRRALVRIEESHWLVVDRIIAEELHDIRLHWLLEDSVGAAQVSMLRPGSAQGMVKVNLPTQAGQYNVAIGGDIDCMEVKSTRGSEDTPNGWFSPRYMERRPALSIAVSTTCREALFWTLLGPSISGVSFASGKLFATLGDKTVRFDISLEADAAIIETVKELPGRKPTLHLLNSTSG